MKEKKMIADELVFVAPGVHDQGARECFNDIITSEMYSSLSSRVDPAMLEHLL